MTKNKIKVLTFHNIQLKTLLLVSVVLFFRNKLCIDCFTKFFRVLINKLLK